MYREALRSFMKIKHILIVLLVISLAGCAKRPIEEMNSAIEAVTRAENDPDAVMYGGGTLARAQEAIRRMNSEADSKRYDTARQAAAEAVSLADRAIEEGRAGASRIADEAAAIIAALRPDIAETGQAIENAKIAGLEVDFDAIERDFENVHLLADQGELALSVSRYQQAIDSGRSARVGLGDINTRLTTSATYATPKK
jgi:hypothetical protein